MLMTSCHAAQVWEVELFASLFSPLWAFAYSVTIYFKALATELRTQAAESSRLNVTWAKREASPCKATALPQTCRCGSEEAGDGPQGLPHSAWIRAVFKHQPHALCPSEVAYSDQPLFPPSATSRKTHYESV